MRTNRHDHCPGSVLIGGMHGSGKTSLVETLITQEPYVRMPALSTRERRSDSDNEYERRSRAELEAMFAEGVLLNLDRVNGEFYAASRADLDELHASGKAAVKEIHPSNFHKFEDYCDGTFPVVLVNQPFVTRPNRLIGVEDQRFTDPFFATSMGKMALDLMDFPDVESAAAHIIHGHQLEQTYSNRYPDPRTIDADNQATYSAVAPVFFDTLRLTTRDFHEASVEPLTRIVSAMPTGSRVLEIGSGSNWLAQAVDLTHLRMTHQESSHGMHELYSADGDRILSPIRKLPIKGGQMDYILGSLVDGMIYPQALLEMQRVLAQNGRIVLTYPSRDWTLSSREGAKKASFNTQGNIQQAHSFSPTPDELENLLRDAGFVLEEFIDCPAAKREKSYYSPALLTSDGSLPESVVSIMVARKVTA